MLVSTVSCFNVNLFRVLVILPVKVLTPDPSITKSLNLRSKALEEFQKDEMRIG